MPARLTRPNFLNLCANEATSVQVTAKQNRIEFKRVERGNWLLKETSGHKKK